uniref:Poly(A) polymerase catalytic subunit domain-containing protein n=1 Tax=viral metagenome TaxID=1070528 RepID=A0A6C0ASK2_9ZZZZ
MKQKNVCKDLTFADCELAILRMAVDKAEEKIGKRIVNSEDIKKIIKTVEDFIKRKNLVCYGGTAINNILPEEDKFYNTEVEIPDYDFFTDNALEDAKELADIYYAQGFTDVEAKAGQHEGTYKVFVNYIPVADITQLPNPIYKSIKKDALRVNGILYAPPNFLRMSMFLELSRPDGDTSRWEKVLKRISLLNKNYPLTSANCNDVDFQREMENPEKQNEIYDNVKNTLVNQGVVFFGGYAVSLYSQYMPENLRKKLDKIADFDVLSNDPETTAEIVKERLKDIGVKNAKIIKRDPVGELVPLHYEIKIGNDTIVFIYKPIACHSYNNFVTKGQKVKIATIDTMLSFYLAFLYADKPYYNQFLDRILCISKFLFDVQQKNRLQQKGLLRRFSITCYGHQESLEEMRAHKAEKYKILKQSQNKIEFEKLFLNYNPETIKERKEYDKTYKSKAKTYKSKAKTYKSKAKTNKSKGNKSKGNKSKSNKNKTNKKKGQFLELY